MHNYFGQSSNTIVIPEYGADAVIKAIAESIDVAETKKNAELNTALDFYYNKDLDIHIEKWFPGTTLKQIPAFPQRLVPRFARARMMLYKSPPTRLISGEVNEEYADMTHQLDSRTREFAEICWLIGEAWMRSKWSEKHERIEYDILGAGVKEYILEGESDPIAISYELPRKSNYDRQFIFWSEARDGVPGMHFQFSQGGERTPIPGNPEMINPYGILPFSKCKNASAASDVIRAAIHISIAMTEIALGVRYALGQPVMTGVDEETKIKSGIDRVIMLPDGATFSYVSPTGDLEQMIEAVKSMANQTAENNHLRIRWGESGGNSPSGEALRILEIENLESRESDEPLWREWEQVRYEVDRVIIETHIGKILPEDLAIDFEEAEFPKSWADTKDELIFKLEQGIMTKKELLLYFNPDMTDEDIESRLGAVAEEKVAEAEATAPTQPAFEGLRKLGTIA
tara:strand:+ start:1626 stop:2996 length:1371 start_codon:yes stop_codon:yes gene_type:complete